LTKTWRIIFWKKAAKEHNPGAHRLWASSYEGASTHFVVI